jgi:threonine dehydrogenase-like Zn-dependent dehydrogenase
LRSSFAVPDIRWPLALDLLRSREIDPDLLISHVYPLTEVDGGLEMAAAHDEPVLKVVIDCR